MEKIRILCYGDSNTWGYISGSDHQRYNVNERWTGILSELLRNNFVVIEEGLNSRTLISFDRRVGKEGKNGGKNGTKNHIWKTRKWKKYLDKPDIMSRSISKDI